MQTPTKKTQPDSVYNRNYHIVFVTKYRNKILTGAVEDHIKEQMPLLCERYEWEHYDTLCIEDWNLRGLVKTKLAKSFNDAASGSFVRMLEYKAEWYYRRIVKVGRFFPSSKKCHGYPHKQHLELSDRQWTCENCHTVHDRDINAAINILVEGLRLLAQSSQVKLALGMRESLNAKGGNIRLAKVSSSR